MSNSLDQELQHRVDAYAAITPILEAARKAGEYSIVIECNRRQCFWREMVRIQASAMNRKVEV